MACCLHVLMHSCHSHQRNCAGKDLANKLTESLMPAESLLPAAAATRGPRAPCTGCCSQPDMSHNSVRHQNGACMCQVQPRNNQVHLRILHDIAATKTEHNSDLNASYHTCI